MTTSINETVLDGREVRRHRNRERAIHGYLDLVRQGVAKPTFEAVADRASLSHRSLYRYFGGLDGLVVAAIRWVVDDFGPKIALPTPATGTLRERCAQFVEQRLLAYEQTSDLTRVALTHHAEVADVAEAMVTAQRMIRSTICAQFEIELSQIPPSRHAEVLVVAHAPFLFGSLEYAHQMLGRDRDRIRVMLTDQLERCFVAALSEQPTTTG